MKTLLLFLGAVLFWSVAIALNLSGMDGSDNKKIDNRIEPRTELRSDVNNDNDRKSDDQLASEL